ncbi:MAG: AMP-binding protein [Bacteroidales bacterium]|nr:AMP-binding protein [Bacteroidales bacterium]
MASVSDFLLEWHDPCHYVEAHTSGSTGEPKTIRLLKSDMRLSAMATNSFFGITSRSILALPLSVSYIAGKMMVVRAEEAGCRLLELPVSNDVMIDREVDLLAIVPSQAESLLAQPDAPRLINHLLLGGASVSADLARRLTQAGFDAYIGYGMTETCSHVALRSLADSEVYTAMPDITFSIDDRDCLVIQSEKFSWGRLVTNDVVRLIDVRHFEWLGRADHAINSGGVKIHPERLEAALRSAIPDLPPFYITKEPHPQWGEAVVMIVEGPSDATLIDRISDAIDDHRRLPKRLIFVDSLPSTPNGNKLRRLTPDEISRIC